MILDKMKRIIRQRLLTREEGEALSKAREQIYREFRKNSDTHPPAILLTHADLRREAKRSGKPLRVVRWCPKAKQVVTETIGA